MQNLREASGPATPLSMFPAVGFGTVFDLICFMGTYASSALFSKKNVLFASRRLRLSLFERPVYCASSFAPPQQPAQLCHAGCSQTVWLNMLNHAESFCWDLFRRHRHLTSSRPL